MMTMPNPVCPKCGKPMKLTTGIVGGDVFQCTDVYDHQMLFENAQSAYIATLEAEIAALKAQIQQMRETSGIVEYREIINGKRSDTVIYGGSFLDSPLDERESE